jgi:hypothetical protein
VRKQILCFLMAGLLLAIAVPGLANLVPTTFGFPVIVQNGSTCAFNQDFASAVDNESLDLKIPAFGDDFQLGGMAMGGGTVTAPGMNFGPGSSVNALPFGPVDLAFPSIAQTNDQTQTVSHCDFAQTSEYAEFAYPFVAAGPVSLPGFGFGF